MLGLIKRTSKLLIAVTALGLIANAVYVSTTQAKPTNRRAVAVIIGNTSYKGSTPAVEYARNDADAFKAFVQDVLGYDPDNIIDMRDASKADLETAFGNSRSYEGKLWRYIDPKGRSDVTVFYSGHGVPGLKDKRGYLLPVDADADAPEINGYPLDLLISNLGKLKVRSMSVFIDACFSGDSPKGMLIQSASGITVVPQLPSESARMTIVTAAQGDQVASWDNKAKHGMFTKHLLDALYGKADGEDYGDGDGQIKLSEVREYLDDRLTRSARREFGRHQNAWIKGDDDKLIVAALPDSPRRTVKKSTPAPVVSKPAPVVKKPEPKLVAPPPKPKKPSFQLASYQRRSTWNISIDFTDIFGADFGGEITMVNGQLSETFYNGQLILNVWGEIRRGSLQLEGTVADRERFVHAPWGPAVEMVPHKFETTVDINGPTTSFSTTARADFSGDTSNVNLRLSLIR